MGWAKAHSDLRGKTMWRRLLLGSAALICAAGVAYMQLVEEHSYGPDHKHRLDVYASSNAENAPVILMLHGGTWTTGSKRVPNVWLAKSRHYRKNGYVFVSANTRLMPEAHPLDQTRDLGRALAYVQKNARNWGGDPERVVLMGHSSGAHVAALLGLRQDLLAEEGATAPIAVVSLDTAAIDVPKGMAGPPRRFLGRVFEDEPTLWRESSPAHFRDPADPPMLIVCSTGRAWPCAYGREFAASTTGVEVLPVDLSHREINGKLGWDGAYTAAVDGWLQTLGLP